MRKVSQPLRFWLHMSSPESILVHVASVTSHASHDAADLCCSVDAARSNADLVQEGHDVQSALASDGGLRVQRKEQLINVFDITLAC